MRILEDPTSSVDLTVRSGRATYVFLSEGRRSVVSCVTEKITEVLTRIGGTARLGAWTSEQLREATATHWQEASN